MKTLMTIAAVAALMISSSVFAEGYGSGGGSSVSQSESGSQAEAGAANGTNYQGNTTINQSSKGVKQHKWVPDATAPGLTTTLTETCMGSSSGGMAISGFGVSGGTTWTDEACIRRLDARELGSQGAKAASLELMCSNPAVRAAVLRAIKQFNKTFVCYDDTPEGIAEAKAKSAADAKSAAASRVSSSTFSWDDED